LFDRNIRVVGNPYRANCQRRDCVLVVDRNAIAATILHDTSVRPTGRWHDVIVDRAVNNLIRDVWIECQPVDLVGQRLPLQRDVDVHNRKHDKRYGRDWHSDLADFAGTWTAVYLWPGRCRLSFFAIHAVWLSL